MKRFILLLIAIYFSIAAFCQSNYWQGLRSGLDYGVHVFFEDTVENVLYVGGEFTKVDTMQNVFFAKWDGTNWQKLGSNLNNYVRAIIRHNGYIYVGGDFTIAGNIDANYIARWNGSEWDSVGSGTNGPVWNFQILNNELYAMGSFDSAGSVVVHSLAKWNGDQWSDVFALPKFDTDGINFIFNLAYYNNELYVAGNFFNGTDINDIIKYNGNSWEKVLGGMYGGMGSVNKMLIYQNELYIAGGFHQSEGNIGNNIQRWDGSQWRTVGMGTNTTIYDMKIHKNELYIGGQFSYVDNIPAQRIAKWNGTQWCALKGIFNNAVYSLGFFRDTLYVGCGTTIDGDTINYIAKWIGGNYTDTCGILNNIIIENNQNSEITIYPNPATNILFIQGEKILEISIFNVIGQKMKYLLNYNQNEIEININELKSGIYLITVITSNGNYNEKIFKE